MRSTARQGIRPEKEWVAVGRNSTKKEESHPKEGAAQFSQEAPQERGVPRPDDSGHP